MKAGVSEVSLLVCEWGNAPKLLLDITKLPFSLDVNTLGRILRDHLPIQGFLSGRWICEDIFSDSKLCTFFFFLPFYQVQEKYFFFISCETAVYIFWTSGKGNQKRTHTAMEQSWQLGSDENREKRNIYTVWSCFVFPSLGLEMVLDS